MKVTRVQYTVRSDFADENKRNIAAVMRELRSLGNDDVRYAVYLQGDGKTFMHLAQQNTPEAERLPTSLELVQAIPSTAEGQSRNPAQGRDVRVGGIGHTDLLVRAQKKNAGLSPGVLIPPRLKVRN